MNSGQLGQLKRFVIPDPSVTYRKLQQGDEYIVIASDGLWDFMGPHTAATTVSPSSPVSLSA